MCLKNEKYKIKYFIMYNSVINDMDSQSFVYLNKTLVHNDVQEQLTNDEQDEDIREDDPLLERIYNEVIEISKNQKDIAIRDVVEKIPSSESAIRNRLNRLVELGKLDCLPGSGRRPSFYSLVNQKEDNQNDEIGLSLPNQQMIQGLEQMIQMLKSQREDVHQQLSKLQQTLTEIEANIEAIEKTILVSKQLSFNDNLKIEEKQEHESFFPSSTLDS